MADKKLLHDQIMTSRTRSSKTEEAKKSFNTFGTKKISEDELKIYWEEKLKKGDSNRRNNLNFKR